MSWSVSIDGGPIDSFEERLDAALEKANIPAQNPAGAEPAALAVKVAKEIVASGLVVKPGQMVGATLSGHANPEHEPVGGWSNDTMNISIWQMTLPK